MKKQLIIILGVLIIIISAVVFNFLHAQKINEKFGLKEINLDGINNLMIIAHPDDDSIWGGANLIKDDFLVICITCGGLETRVDEFERAMAITNDKYMMLNYPDKKNGQRDNWKEHRNNIKKDLETIIFRKDWEKIVTHNPDGEYGHIHHEILNEIVTSITTDNLYYFGKYYSKSHIEENVSPKLSEELINKKLDLLKIYESQNFIEDKFGQMYSYEDWLSYTEWQELYGN